MSTQKRYRYELRERSVRLVFESGRPIAQVAKDLAIGPQSLRTWVRQAEADAGERADRLTSGERVYPNLPPYATSVKRRPSHPSAELAPRTQPYGHALV